MVSSNERTQGKADESSGDEGAGEPDQIRGPGHEQNRKANRREHTHLSGRNAPCSDAEREPLAVLNES